MTTPNNHPTMGLDLWSDMGQCDTCGAVPGWPCHRGQRQLKNPHRGRPMTGQEPYVLTQVAAGDGPAPERTHHPHPAHSTYTVISQGPITVTSDSFLPELDNAGVETPMALDVVGDHQESQYALDNAEAKPDNPTGARRSDAEVPADVPRDRWKRPEIVRAVQDASGAWVVPIAEDGSRIYEMVGTTRASSLGNALEDATGLNIWRGGMIAYGMSRRKDLQLAAKAIPGTEDKERHRKPLYRIAEKALDHAEADSAATIGTALHALTEQVDAGTLAVDIGDYQPTLDAYALAMAGWRVVRSETFVVSDHFHAAGSFDRLITPIEPMALVDNATGEIIAVIMPGDLVVVDLKTSTTADYFGAKFFAQLAVYVTGAEYVRDREDPRFGDRIPLGQRTDFALILHIPQGGDTATWQWLDMRAGLALAQLACVNLEIRKKRFTRTHMRPVLAMPYTGDPTAEATVEGRRGGPKAQPSQFGPPAAREPFGSDHLAAVAPAIEAGREFPDDRADAVDAELAEDGAPPEERTPPPSTLTGRNLGAWTTEDVAAEAERTGESEEQVEDRLERAAEAGVTVHRPEPQGPSAFVKLAQAQGIVPGPDPALAEQLQEDAQHLASESCTCPMRMVCDECCHDPGCPEADDPSTWCDCMYDETCSGPLSCRRRAHGPERHAQEGAELEAGPGGPHKGDDYDGERMPGPDETAPLPAGWESQREQVAAAVPDPADRSTIAEPAGLGPSLQEAAKRHQVETTLIRKIEAATSVRGPDGLADLYARASAAGYWSDRVKAAASARRVQLEGRAG